MISVKTLHERSKFNHPKCKLEETLDHSITIC